MTEKFTVKPIYQKHKPSDLEKNIEAVKNSEIFFIFGNRAYVNGCRKINSDTIRLINLAKRMNKPFVLCLDNSLPLSDQVFLRGLCPTNVQVFSFNPALYSDLELHKRMMVIINGAINNETISDPFIE